MGVISGAVRPQKAAGGKRMAKKRGKKRASGGGTGTGIKRVGRMYIHDYTLDYTWFHETDLDAQTSGLAE